MLLSSLCRPCASSPLALSLASVWLRGWVFFILSKPRRFAKLHSACPDSHPKKVLACRLTSLALGAPSTAPLSSLASASALARSPPALASSLALRPVARHFCASLRAPRSLVPVSCVTLRASVALALRLAPRLRPVARRPRAPPADAVDLCSAGRGCAPDPPSMRAHARAYLSALLFYIC